MRKLLKAALFCSTALVMPQPAQAGFLLPFISGLTGGALFATAGNIALLTGGAGAFAFSVGSFLGGSFLGRTALGLGISALTRRRRQNNQPQQKPSATLANFAQPISYAAQKYGRSRTGGPLGFTGAKNSRRYYVPIFAAHEIDGVEEHWLDEYTVGVDPSVTSPGQQNIITKAEDPQYTAPGILRNYGRIDFFTGAPGQVANANLVNQFSEITNDHDFASLAGAYVWAKKPSAEKFSRVYPRGREWAYTPVIRGDNNIYDPRDDTRKYTANAALVWAHWVTEILGRNVNWDKIAVEADECDTLVTTRFEGDIPKWEINGGLTDDQTFEAQRQALITACDGFMYEDADGSVGLYVGRWIEPTVTVTASDCLQVSVSQNNTGAATEVFATYVDQTSTWREAPSGTIILAIDENTTREEIPADMVIYHNQASRIVKRYGRALRPQARMSGVIGSIGYDLRGQRFFTLEHPGAPNGSQYFEITKFERVTASTFSIEAVSVEPGDFAFNAAAEEPDKPVRNKVASEFLTPDVTGVTAAAIGSNAIQVAWDAQDDFLWQRVRWKTAADTEYQTAIVDGGQTEYIITGLVDGQTYEIQVVNVTAVTLSSPSDPAPDPALTVKVVANSTPPPALAAFTATPTGSDVLLEWTAPNDPNYFGVILYRGTTTVFADANAIHTEYASSGVASYTDAGLLAGTYYYFANPINASGIGGNTSGPLTVVIT